MTVDDIKEMSKDGAFAANMSRSGQIYGLCYKYKMPWENLDWVNTFRHLKEAEVIFEEVEKYPGDYPEKIYAWAHHE